MNLLPCQKKIISLYVQCTRHKQYCTFRQNFGRVEGGKIYPQGMSKFSIPLIGGNSYGRNGATSHRIGMICLPYPSGIEVGLKLVQIILISRRKEKGREESAPCGFAAVVQTWDQGISVTSRKGINASATLRKKERDIERYLVQYFPYSWSSHRKIVAAGSSSGMVWQNYLHLSQLGGGGVGFIQYSFPMMITTCQMLLMEAEEGDYSLLIYTESEGGERGACLEMEFTAGCFKRQQCLGYLRSPLHHPQMESSHGLLKVRYYRFWPVPGAVKVDPLIRNLTCCGFGVTSHYFFVSNFK